MTDGSTAVDDYVAGFPDAVRDRLIRVQEILLAAMPGGEQKVRYGIPAVMLDGRYGLHFAGWKKHLGLYPVPVFNGTLEAEVQPYRSGKDSVTFLHSRPLPEDLIARVALMIVERRGA